MEEQELNSNNTNSGNKSSKHAIFVVVFIAIIVGVVYLVIKMNNESYLTYSNYTKIQNGMSYSQVVEILDGHQGTLDSDVGYGGYRSTTYIWSNSDSTKIIIVMFDNGAVTAKSQMGLS